MSEVDTSPENHKIPENWNFLEKDTPGLKVAQLDIPSKFLAFTLPEPSLRTTNIFYHLGLQSAEYFFDEQGNVLCCRMGKNEDDANIEMTGDLRSRYRIYGIENDRSNYVSIGFINSDEYERGDYYRSLSLSNDVNYKDGELWDLRMSVLFTKLQNKDTHATVKSPGFTVIRRTTRILKDSNTFVLGGKVLPPRDGAEYRYEDFLFDFGKNKNNSQDGEVLVFHKEKKEALFKINYGIQKGEDAEEDNDDQFLVISQTHIPTSIVKTLRAPLRISFKKVQSAVLPQPPYGKERIAGQDILVVPWRNIDRIVGANLSYSYPPPSSKK